MAYTTVPQWLDVYPNLSKSAASSATLFSWLEKGAGYIDGYIRSVVATVPVTPIPQVLKDLNDDLSYVMFLRRNAVEAGKSQGLRDMWDDCMKRLDDIRSGNIIIVGSGGEVLSTQTQGSSPWSNVMEYQPTFGVKEIEDAVVDSDRVYDEWANTSVNSLG
jgi:hypothetical protein